MKVYSFPRGGLLYDDPTAPSADSGSVSFLPSILVIPLEQYPEGKAFPVVSPGDTVHEGMLIGRANGRGSANVHATVPGKVLRIVEWKGHEGQVNRGVVIRMDGSFDILGRNEEIASVDDLNFSGLIKILSDCGIVEMEGTGRPVAEILTSFHESAHKQTLVVRCVFDDPWLVADYVLLKDRLQAVVEGSFFIAKANKKIKHILFAVSQREKKIGQALLNAAVELGVTAQDIPFSMVLTGSRYPQRNDRELEIALRNYGEKEGIDLGKLLVFGPATLAAVYDAVCYRRPILERYVAVGGSAVCNPQVMRVRIGKRIRDLFEECGGFKVIPDRIAVGSPVFGKTVIELDEPVAKTCYAVLAMLKNQIGNYPARNCISCGECRAVCPVGLDPEELYKRKTHDNPTVVPESDECHGCGCCEVVCPSHLPLSDVITGTVKTVSSVEAGIA